MQIFSRKTSFINLILVSLLFFIISNSYAAIAIAPVEKSDSNGGLSVAKCILNGESEYRVFLDSVIYSDGIKDGLFEPWKDVVSRNKCQSSDIYGLIVQRDKIRSYIRTAYLTCNTQKIPKLKKAFYSYNAEIYYVRHIVKNDIIVGLPYTSIEVNLSKDKKSLLSDPAKIRKEIEDKYTGENKIAKKDFPKFYENLEKKYVDRTDKYIKCDDDLTWKNIVNKTKESTKKFTDSSDKALKNAKNSIGGSIEKLGEAISFPYEITSIVQINTDKIALQKTFNEFLTIDSAFGVRKSQEDALRSLYQESRAFDKDTIIKTLTGQFEALYRVGNDTAIEQILLELTGTDNAINYGTKSLGTLLKCMTRLKNKQCSETK